VDNFFDNLKNYKLPLILCLLGLTLVAGGVYSSNIFPKPQTNTYSSASKISSKDINGTPDQLKVDLSGAVKKPGVYTLDKDGRVEDAVKLAGGFSAKANTEYISKYVNLSLKISDGMKIYIPSIGEQTPASTSQSAQSTGQSAVSINSSSLKDLDSLPGIGEVTAQKIINGRPYNSLDELVSKKAISKSVWTKIKDSVQLN
jgi:competence protein ComEA